MRSFCLSSQHCLCTEVLSDLLLVFAFSCIHGWPCCCLSHSVCSARGSYTLGDIITLELQATMNSVMGEWTALLLRTFQAQAPGSSKSPWSVVFRDALLRRLVLRFVLCRAALTLHATAGANPSNLPKVFPELPKEVGLISRVPVSCVQFDHAQHRLVG